MADHFWLSAAQWTVIEPHVPKVYTGKRRVDDRRVISGIVHRLRDGCRRRTLPDVYGPYTTVFNRYNRWSRRGLWQRILMALNEDVDPPVVAMIDSTSVKAHRSAAGAMPSGLTPARAAVGPPRFTSWWTRPVAPGGSSSRPARRPTSSRPTT